MKQFKKVLAILLTVLMIVSAAPLSAFAADPATGKIIVESKSVLSGDTVEVNVVIQDNPGILGATLAFSYDKSLTLVAASAGEAFGALVMTRPGKFTSPCQFVWDGESLSPEDIKDGVILTLTFAVSNEAVVGSDLAVNISYRNGDIVDANLRPLTVEMVSSKLLVIDYIPGDVNGDKVVNSTDVILMRRHIAGGYDQSINELAADVNDDGICNSTDVILTRRYIAGGYDVVLLPSHGKCNHILDATEAKMATCTEDGNIAYWQCSICKKCFSDAEGLLEISADSIIVEATGHTPVDDPAVPATYTSTGLTAGSHCAVCGEVLVAQEEYGPLVQDQYSIEYFIFGNDEYLAGITIQNPNPLLYTSEAGVDWLEDLVVPGYIFEGWFDGQGSAASRVTSIAKGSARNIKLYAKWTKEKYTITFDNSSMNLPSSSMQYTVDQKITLEKPTVDRYVFLGWTTDSDELKSEIMPGTTGNFTLHSNWTSKRNLAKPVETLGDPIIIEDTNTGRLLFTYEIGQVENVPLYTIKNLPSAGGVVSVYTETVSKRIETTDAATVAKAIDHITTDSTAWTLSEDWNETTHVEDSVLNEHGYNRTTGQQVGKTSSNTYTLTTNEYDNTVVKANEGTVATTTQYNTTDVDSRETWESKASLSVSDTESAKYTDSASVSAEVGVGYGPVSAKVGASAETSTEISSSTTAGSAVEATVAHENTSHTKTGTDTVTVADNTKTTTTDKGWSKSGSSSSSSSSSLTQYEEATLSERIASEYTYGQSYAKGGSNSNSAASATSLGESSQYSTTFTYFNSEEKTEGTSYTINGESDGSYRLVRAGIVHVFAVVIYDIANAQYSVTTYAVLDDETYTYIDYSATSAAKFNDNENGVLPFEIPYFVNDYVNGRIVATDGLKYNEVTLSTGEYKGSETSVVVPEFISVDNQDGTNSAYTIRNLSADTFAGNTEIKSVLLSSFIREIPDSAFEGCSSLEFVYGSEIRAIGDNAFNGCSALGEFKVANTIESIGKNAFKDVNSIVVEASSPEVVLGAINSGAKRITINISAIADDLSGITLTIPDSVEYFELQGGRNEFNGMKIISDAGETVLNGVIINSSTGVPLEISSEKLTLNQVGVESPGYAMLLKGNAPTISLYGTSRLVAGSSNAVVCRNVSFVEIGSNVSAKLECTGNVQYYGTLNNATMVKFTERGEFVELTSDEYDKYIKGTVCINLDANGGEVATSSVTAYLGAEVGSLPTPTRDYYTFNGWYTAKSGGTKITSSYVFSGDTDVTVYAQWTENPLSDWVKASSAPSNAQIVNRKYSYTQRVYKTNSSSSLSGWTKYDTKRTGWGATQGPVYSDPSNGSRNVWSESYVVSSNYKTIYHYYRWASQNNDSGGDSSNSKYGDCIYYREIALDYELSSGVNEYGTTFYKYYYNGVNYKWYFKCDPYTTQQWVSDNYGTRWYYQEPVYTYYFYQDQQKESTSYPTGSDISNIVEWVQYRAK